MMNLNKEGNREKLEEVCYKSIAHSAYLRFKMFQPSLSPQLEAVPFYMTVIPEGLKLWKCVGCLDH